MSLFGLSFLLSPEQVPLDILNPGDVIHFQSSTDHDKSDPFTFVNKEIYIPEYNRLHKDEVIIDYHIMTEDAKMKEHFDFMGYGWQCMNDIIQASPSIPTCQYTNEYFKIVNKRGYEHA